MLMLLPQWPSCGEHSKFSFFANRSATRCLSLILFFGIWQVLCITGFKFFINFQLVPSPWEVVGATVEFFTSDPGRSRVKSPILSRVFFGNRVLLRASQLLPGIRRYFLK